MNALIYKSLRMTQLISFLHYCGSWQPNQYTNSWRLLFWLTRSWLPAMLKCKTRSKLRSDGNEMSRNSPHDMDTHNPAIKISSPSLEARG